MRRLAILLVGILGSVACKPRRPSVGQRSPEQATQPRTENDDDDPRRALTREAAERLAAALSNHPEPFLIVRAPNKAISLRAAMGGPVSLEIAIPNVRGWGDAEVTRFVVRLSGGTQKTVPIDPKAFSGPISYVFPATGPAMLMFCAGPRADASRDASEPTHCSKVIVNVGDGHPGRDGADDLTGETGLPLDVEPLVPPSRLRVGSVLPVRFHYLNEEQGGVEAVALRPDGTVDRQIASRSGVAHFLMNEAGRWTIRFGMVEGDRERIGELVFELAENRE